MPSVVQDQDLLDAGTSGRDCRQACSTMTDTRADEEGETKALPADLFDDLLSLEDKFYQEGYDAGLADGEHAGLVEGKVFGIEKGYEKALELGRLHGRALVWQMRQAQTTDKPESTDREEPMLATLGHSKLPKNTRLTKHIEGLLALTDDKDLVMDNSDEAVTEFDESLAKAQAKAKVIAAIVGEPLKLDVSSAAGSGIEESLGLNARH